MEDRVAVPPVRARLKSFAARVAVDWAVPPKTASEKITETEVLSEAMELELIVGGSLISLTLTVRALEKVLVPSLA